MEANGREPRRGLILVPAAGCLSSCVTWISPSLGGRDPPFSPLDKEWGATKAPPAWQLQK